MDAAERLSRQRNIMRISKNEPQGASKLDMMVSDQHDRPITTKRSLAPLLLSFGYHLVLFVIIGVIWGSQSHGTTEMITDRPIGIAVVHQLPDRQRYTEVVSQDKVSDNQDDVNQSTSQSSSLAPPSSLTPPLDLAGVLNSLQSLPSPVNGTGLSGESELSGDAYSTGAGQQPGDGEETTTMLFGVSGSGSHFVYVFDRSDSMNGFSGKPLRAAKSELLKSLGSLTERQQFQIIFYNDQPRPFSLPGMPMSMVRAEKSNLDLAKKYVSSIAAYGGTEHESALKLALRMGPDVIFFLTDARVPRLSEGELRELQVRATSSGTTVHCIEFGSDREAPTDSFLIDLAKMNQGQYRYIDVQGLVD